MKFNSHEKKMAYNIYFFLPQGTLVQAIRSGDWILLDEINLAAMETLECLSGLLESTAGSVLLMERGYVIKVVKQAPDHCGC